MKLEETRRERRPLRRRLGQIGIAALATGLVIVGVQTPAGAFLPVDGTTTTSIFDGGDLTETASWLTERLSDPSFVASLGTTQAERDEAVAALRGLVLENPPDPTAANDALIASEWTTELAAQATTTQQAATTYEASVTAAEAARKADIAGAPTLTQVAAAGTAAPSTVAPTGVLAPSGKAGWSDFQSAALSAAAAHSTARLNGPTAGCSARTEANPRHAPTTTTRSGTIFTPSEETFADATGSTVYTGQMTTRIGASGVREFKVEGHLEVPAGAPVAASDFAYYAATVFLQGLTTAPGTEPSVVATEYYCYAEDAASTAAVTRAYWRAWVPMTRPAPNAYALAEPGFQLRAATHDAFWAGGLNRLFFLGADQRYVHLGPSPLPHMTADPQGVGLNLFPDFVVDGNKTAGDDVETSVIKPQFSSIVNGFLSRLPGYYVTVGGPRNKMLKVNLKQLVPGTSDIDASFEPASDPDHNEERLRLDVSMKDLYFAAHLRSALLLVLGPLTAATGCNVSAKVDLKLTAWVSVDVRDGAPTIIEPDVQFGNESLKIHDVWAQHFPLGCNIGYALAADVVRNKLVGLIKDQLGGPTVMSAISNLGSELKLSTLLSPSFALPNGNSVGVSFQGFRDTCQPYGCNGSHTGDIAMQHHGTEAQANFVIGDRKPASATRRFPVSYQPTTTSTVRDVIRQHYSADDEIYDVSAVLSPGLVNQALRTVSEGGMADASVAGLTFQSRAAPFVTRWAGLTAPVGLAVPELHVATTAGELYAVGARAAIGLQFDRGSGVLSPGTITLTGPQAAVNLNVLQCNSLLWLACALLPSAAATIVNTLANQLLPAVLTKSIGRIRVPEIAGFTVGGLHLDNEGGNIVVRGSVGGPQVFAWSWVGTNVFGFTKTWEGLPGTGTPTFSWFVWDPIPLPTPTLASGPTIPSMFSTSILTPSIYGGGRSAAAIVSASRGGITKLAAASVSIP